VQEPADGGEVGAVGHRHTVRLRLSVPRWPGPGHRGWMGRAIRGGTPGQAWAAWHPRVLDAARALPRG
jgi:hypothetical protein